MLIAVKNGKKSPKIIAGKIRKSSKSLAIIEHYCALHYCHLFPYNPTQPSATANIYSHAIKTADEMAADILDDILTPAINTKTRSNG